jgi:hypothetical protein
MVFFRVDMHQVTLDTFKITHATNLASQIYSFYNFALGIPSLRSMVTGLPFFPPFFYRQFLSFLPKR